MYVGKMDMRAREFYRRPPVVHGYQIPRENGEWPEHWFREPKTFLGKEYKFTSTTKGAIVFFYCEGICIASEMMKAIQWNGEYMNPAHYNGHYAGGPWCMASYLQNTTIGQETTLSVALPEGSTADPSNGFFHVIEIPDTHTTVYNDPRVSRDSTGGASWAKRERKVGDSTLVFGYSNHPSAWPIRFRQRDPTTGGDFKPIPFIVTETQLGDGGYARAYGKYDTTEDGEFFLSVSFDGNYYVCQYNLAITPKPVP